MSDPTLRHPTPDDGLAVWKLVRDSGVLDRNSVYAYCATFRSFSATCVVASGGDGLAGFVTGWRLPAQPEVLFVWQVGVAVSHRGQGLATTMLRYLLDAPGGRTATFIQTTVTPDNAPSRALFHGLARKLKTACEVQTGFTSDQLGPGHAPEELFVIGPIHRSDS